LKAFTLSTNNVSRSVMEAVQFEKASVSVSILGRKLFSFEDYG
jgi:hypothetical protein